MTENRFPQDHELGQVSEEQFPSEEDFAPTPPKPRGPLEYFPSRDALWPVVWCFTFCVIASLVFWLTPYAAYLPVSRTSVFEKYEFYRLFTAILTHADFAHLLSNAPLFIIFGWLLYGYFGRLMFPNLSFLVGILANAATIYFYPANTQLIGASGMVYGMVGMWLVLYCRYETTHSLSFRFVRCCGFSLIVMFPTAFHPETSYLAHATGFIIGIIIAFIFSKSVQPQISSAS